MIESKQLAEPLELKKNQSLLSNAEIALRADRWHLIIVETGSGMIVAENSEQAFEGSTIFWMPSGLKRHVRLLAGSVCQTVCLSNTHLAQAVPTGNVGNVLRASLDSESRIEIKSSSDLIVYQRHIDTIKAEQKASRLASALVVQHSLTLLLIEYWRAFQIENSAAQSYPGNLLETFVLFANKHGRDHLTVSRYADMLGVSRDRLSSAIKRGTGMSPTTFLHLRLMADAKELLMESGLQVTQIAFELGFTDAAYFNRFFQRYAGTPPGKYRASAQRLKRGKNTSFSAWP